MKWYPIRKYKPPTTCDLLIRIEKDTGSYDRYLIAVCEDYTVMNDPSTWEMSNNAHIDVPLCDYTVTHFAIPDPILIEDIE